MISFNGALIVHGDKACDLRRRHVVVVCSSPVFLVSCFNFSFSISLVDENLLNFSCSFSRF